MIEKMPHIAVEAVEQFHNIDRAFRKHYFYLSYLEKDPKFLAEPSPSTTREKREKKEKEKESKRAMKEKGIKKLKREKTFAKVPIEVGQYSSSLKREIREVSSSCLFVLSPHLVS